MRALIAMLGLIRVLGLALPAAAQDTGHALVAAAAAGDLAATSRLLQQGVPANATRALARRGTWQGDDPATAPTAGSAQTALCAAAQAGSVEIARLLLTAGADVDRACPLGAPLAIAALRGDARMAGLLLSARAYPDVRDGAGATPLYRAVLAGDEALARRLLAARADPNLRSPGVGAVPPSSGLPLIEAARQGRAGLVEALLDAGATPSAHGGDGRSALFWAIVEGTEEAALLLIERGANPAESAGTYSLQHYARSMGKPRVAERIAGRKKSQ